MPNSSAAGIDTVGSVPSAPCEAASAARSARVMAPRASMSATSCGHFSDATHTTPGSSAAKTYPPTPSTPLAS
eukprot:5570050-Pleurochrysis_carterae.AAC.1